MCTKIVQSLGHWFNDSVKVKTVNAIEKRFLCAVLNVTRLCILYLAVSRTVMMSSILSSNLLNI